MKPKVICITGGLGSGKSTVAERLLALGHPVYFSDQRAKELMQEDKDLKFKIINLLGAESYTPEGRLNRSIVAAQIFENKTIKTELEHLVHPVVRSDFHKWTLANQSHAILFKESALVFETGDQSCEQILVVETPLTVRIERILKREPHWTEEQAKARISHQVSEQVRKEKANFMIYNEAGLDELYDQIDQFLLKCI